MNARDEESRKISPKSKYRFEFWINFIKSKKVKFMLEIGVWKGDFSKKILEQCESIERYYMIDPWANLPDWNKPYNVNPELFNDVYQEAISKTAFASDKISVLRGRTKEVIDNIPNESLDFAYIDGDHTLRGITIDLIKSLPKIKKNGVIGGDDFINNPWQHDAQFEPTLVCPFSIYFAEAMDLPITALPFNQFLIEKNEKSCFSFTDETGEYKDLSLNKFPLSSEDNDDSIKDKLKRIIKIMIE